MKVYKEEMVCLNEIIEKNSDFFNEQAKAKNLTIKKKIYEKVLVKLNPDLAEILINNLFLNTFIPNMNNGIIVITHTNQSLTFSNCRRIVPLHPGKFKRFSKMGSSGEAQRLGLAIGMRIVKSNRWSIQYSFLNPLQQFEKIFQNGN